MRQSRGADSGESVPNATADCPDFRTDYADGPSRQLIWNFFCYYSPRRHGEHGAPRRLTLWKHGSQIDSSNPGPRCLCDSIVQPTILYEISSVYHFFEKSTPCFSVPSVSPWFLLLFCRCCVVTLIRCWHHGNA